MSQAGEAGPNPAIASAARTGAITHASAEDGREDGWPLRAGVGGSWRPGGEDTIGSRQVTIEISTGPEETP